MAYIVKKNVVNTVIDEIYFGTKMSIANNFVTKISDGNLDNDENDKVRKRSAQASASENGEVWGRAFWQCRQELGKNLVDRVLFQAWKQTTTLSDSADALRGFSKSVLALAAERDERVARCFTLQFQKRNLPM